MKQVKTYNFIEIQTILFRVKNNFILVKPLKMKAIEELKEYLFHH